MRLLIAHDGSEISNHAIEDLKLAGLPPACEAVIMSIAEIPAPAFEIVTAGRGHFENYLPEPEISGASELQVAQSHAAPSSPTGLFVPTPASIPSPAPSSARPTRGNPTFSSSAQKAAATSALSAGRC
jgi:hypothetical protein